MLKITSVKPSLSDVSLRDSSHSFGSKSSIDSNSQDARPSNSISNIDQGTNIDQSISSRSMPNVHTSSNETISDTKLDTRTISGSRFSLESLSQLSCKFVSKSCSEDTKCFECHSSSKSMFNS